MLLRGGKRLGGDGLGREGVVGEWLVGSIGEGLIWLGGERLYKWRHVELAWEGEVGVELDTAVGGRVEMEALELQRQNWRETL